MSLDFASLIVDDFSGGITDYTLNAPTNKAEALDNLMINPNRKPITRPGSLIYDENMYQIPDGVQRITGLIDTQDALYINSARKIWYPNTSAFTELVGPSSNPVFAGGDTTNFISWAEWNGHIFATSDALVAPQKIYPSTLGVPQVRTAGLPALASSPTVTRGAAGAGTYIYKFVHYYTYTLGTGSVVFEDFGPVTSVQLITSAAPNANTVNITNIPILANSSTGNYDTTNIKIKIYRSTDGGNTFYYIGQVTNGTTSYADSKSDTTIQADNILLYTDGGVVENDPPPSAKYVHIVNGFAYYAHILEGSQTLSNRVRQSLKDDPDSCPGDFYADVKDSITGVSSHANVPIVLGTSKIYRLDGAYDELGQGGITYEEISKTTGCVSARSIVQTREGVFFAGTDGFYWTDGYQVKKISDSINETYKVLTATDDSKARIYGKYDPTESRVYWAVQSDTSSSDNDALFVLDLRWGVRADSTFTTWSNDDSFAPTALGIFDGNLIRCDRRGYIFKHHTDYQTDPKVDTTAIPSLWATKAIVYNYLSPHMDFGLPQTRKWAPRMLLTADNYSELSVQITSFNDQSTVGRDLKIIRSRDNIAWGNPTPEWGDDDFVWAAFGLVEQWRRFPARSLRFSHKQIQITNAYTNIYRSDDFATANIDATLKTATLTDAAYSWAAPSVDYYISFESDDYTIDYLITAISGTLLTYQDVSNTSVTGLGKKWIIRGIPKAEVFNLQKYVIYYAPLTPSFRTYRGGDEEDGTNEEVVVVP
jgi:hypothetical protein